MSSLHSHFEDAVEALDKGDLNALKQLVENNPELVHIKQDSVEEPYAGYFYNATLLHHIAFNPTRDKEMPANIVEITRLLLEAGADPNAICGGGPTQPGTDHGTVIGLIVSGYQGINKGLAAPLVKLLVEYGAELEYGEAGINLFGALYHTVENRRQREAARILYDLGHDIDMVFAAGLGLLHSVKGYFRSDTELKEGADRLFRHHRRTDTNPATDPEVLQDCFLAACINNELEVMDWLWTTQNLDINAFRRWGPWMVTPLHAACWSGWLEATQYLVEKGADTMLHDPEHNTTPIGWAHYCGRTEVYNWFEPQDELFNMFDAIELGKNQRFKDLFGDQNPNMAIGGGSEGVLLRIAANDGNTDLMTFLLEKGGDPTLQNPQGNSAVSLAKEKKHQQILDLIEGHLG